MTKQRRLIVSIIQQSDKHLSAEEIYVQAKQQMPMIVLATVYNNLNKLWTAGLIRKVSMEGMPDRYDTVQKHDHLVCRRCGKISDICFADLTAPLRSQLGEDFLFYDLKVFYLCPECRKLEQNHRMVSET